jgi:osmotically-inducible protein OsmY
VHVQTQVRDGKRTLDQAAAALDDATVTAKVKAALIATPRVKGLAIDVATRQNVVTLSGSVESAAMRTDAERVATSIEGVKEVSNQLTVKPPS